MTSAPVLRCARCRCYEPASTLTRKGEEFVCPRCARPLCKPDTACGPGECGMPAAYAVDRWPSYGSTWGRLETLHICQAHAVSLAWHYGLLRRLACGETEVRWPATHRCASEEELCTGASDSPADSGGSTAPRCASGAGAITVGSGIPRG